MIGLKTRQDSIQNQQYKPTNYLKYIKWKTNIKNDLQSIIDKFKPEIIHISGIFLHSW